MASGMAETALSTMATKNIAPGLAPTHQELDDSDEEKPTTTSFEEVEEKYPVTYTEEEEKRVVRKIDWRLLPISESRLSGFQSVLTCVLT